MSRHRNQDHPSTTHKHPCAPQTPALHKPPSFYVHLAPAAGRSLYSHEGAWINFSYHSNSAALAPPPNASGAGAQQPLPPGQGGPLLGNVVRDIKQGDSTLFIHLTSPNRAPSRGQWVRLLADDPPDGAALATLYGPASPESIWPSNMFNGPNASMGPARGLGYALPVMRFAARVVKYDASTGAVRLSRPVPYNVRAAWNARLET